MKFYYFYFILSIYFLLSSLSLTYLTRYRYILFILTIFLLINNSKSILKILKKSFVKLNFLVVNTEKKYKNFSSNNKLVFHSKLILLTVLISAIIGRYDLFYLNSYLSSSLNQMKNIVINQNLKDGSNGSDKSIVVHQPIKNKNLKILFLRKNDKISLLDNNFKDTKIFKNQSKELSNSIPFHVMSNGDLIISKAWWFDNSGLLRVNKNFEKIWELDKEVHHYASVSKKNLFVPSFSNLRWIDFKSSDLYQQFKDYNCNPEAKKFYNSSLYEWLKTGPTGVPKNYKSNEPIRIDEILKIDLDSGKVIKKINLLEILTKDKHFLNIIRSSKNARCSDLLHLNDIVKIKDKQIEKLIDNKVLNSNKIFKNLFLISLRDINTLAILDFEESKILWSISGLTNSQHSPRLTGNGNLIVFDNLDHEFQGSNFGFSSIKEINLENNKIVSTYKGDLDNNFNSKRRGRIQLINDHLYVLASDQEKFYKVSCEPQEKIFLNNCKTNLLFSLKKNTIEDSTVFISDLYKKTNNKFLLAE